MVTAQARPLVHGIDIGVVEDAIRAAELRTSGEIRVALARFWFWGDVKRSAGLEMSNARGNALPQSIVRVSARSVARSGGARPRRIFDMRCAGFGSSQDSQPP